MSYKSFKCLSVMDCATSGAPPELATMQLLALGLSQDDSDDEKGGGCFSRPDFWFDLDFCFDGQHSLGLCGTVSVKSTSSVTVCSIVLLLPGDMPKVLETFDLSLADDPIIRYVYEVRNNSVSFWNVLFNTDMTFSTEWHTDGSTNWANSLIR